MESRIWNEAPIGAEMNIELKIRLEPSDVEEPIRRSTAIVEQLEMFTEALHRGDVKVIQYQASNLRLSMVEFFACIDSIGVVPEDVQKGIDAIHAGLERVHQIRSSAALNGVRLDPSGGKYR